jgi:hypothetical protein
LLLPPLMLRIQYSYFFVYRDLEVPRNYTSR